MLRSDLLMLHDDLAMLHDVPRALRAAAGVQHEACRQLHVGCSVLHDSLRLYQVAMAVTVLGGVDYRWTRSPAAPAPSCKGGERRGKKTLVSDRQPHRSRLTIGKAL